MLSDKFFVSCSQSRPPGAEAASRTAGPARARTHLSCHTDLILGADYMKRPNDDTFVINTLVAIVVAMESVLACPQTSVGVRPSRWRPLFPGFSCDGGSARTCRCLAG